MTRTAVGCVSTPCRGTYAAVVLLLLYRGKLEIRVSIGVLSLPHVLSGVCVEYVDETPLFHWPALSSAGVSVAVVSGTVFCQRR